MATGVVADNARGLFAGKDIYHDADPAQIASIPATQPHRTVDLTIEAADTAGQSPSLMSTSLTTKISTLNRLRKYVHRLATNGIRDSLWASCRHRVSKQPFNTNPSSNRGAFRPAHRNTGLDEVLFGVTGLY